VYVFEAGVDGEGEMMYVDAIQEGSCYGRFINDPRDDSLVNAKVVLKGGRLMVIATTEILHGEEIYIDYGVEYWLDRLDCLSKEDAAMVEAQARQKGLLTEGRRPIPLKRIVLADLREQPTAVRRREVRSAIEQMTDVEREKYTIDNVEQTEELAEELQYLVGQDYYDDENGVHYFVESVMYDERHKAVIGYRKAQDGKNHADDDAPLLVYGDSGILQLVDLWKVDQETVQVHWPSTDGEWAQQQREDPELVGKIAKVGDVLETHVKVGHDFLALIGPAKVLHRMYTFKGRTIWQK
jgi:hypothetical protein